MRSTGIHSSASACVPPSDSRVRRISGPGLLWYGFDGNHCVNASRHMYWSVCGNGPVLSNTAQDPAGTVSASMSSGTAAPVTTPW